MHKCSFLLSAIIPVTYSKMNTVTACIENSNAISEFDKPKLSKYTINIGYSKSLFPIIIPSSNNVSFSFFLTLSLLPNQLVFKFHKYIYESFKFL